MECFVGVPEAGGGERRDMADGNDVLLELWKEQREAKRHTEVQRAALTNIIIIVVAAGLGFIADKGLRTSMLVVTLAMMVLGLYGAFFCLKFYERSEFHTEQARGLRKQMYSGLGLEAGLRETSDAQRERFRRMRKIRLYALWVALHCAIAAAGAALSVWIIVS